MSLSSALSHPSDISAPEGRIAEWSPRPDGPGVTPPAAKPLLALTSRDVLDEIRRRLALSGRRRD